MSLRHILLSTLGLCILSAPAQARSWVDEPENRVVTNVVMEDTIVMRSDTVFREVRVANANVADVVILTNKTFQVLGKNCLLYTSPSPRDQRGSRMPSSA